MKIELLTKKEDILLYTLNKYNLTMDISYQYDGYGGIGSFILNILSDDIVIIKDEKYSPQTDEYISNLIVEYYINKRNDIINDILKCG